MKTNFFKITLLALLLAAGTKMTHTMQQNRPFNADQEYDSLMNDLKIILHKHNYPTLPTQWEKDASFSILDNYCRTRGAAFGEQMYPEYYPNMRHNDDSIRIFRNTFLQSCLDYFALTGIYAPAPTSPLSTHSVDTQRATPISSTEPSLATVSQSADEQFVASFLNLDSSDIVQK
jgi:hypothetical protein